MLCQLGLSTLLGLLTSVGVCRSHKGQQCIGRVTEGVLTVYSGLQTAKDPVDLFARSIGCVADEGMVGTGD